MISEHAISGAGCAVRRDPEFAKALLDEATTVFLNGEADPPRLVLRDLVNSELPVEAFLEFVIMGFQRGLGEGFTPLADGAGAFE